MKRRGIVKKISAMLVSTAMIFGMCAASPVGNVQNVEAAGTKTTLSNPRKDSKGNVTYDCIWFGSYPQSDNTGKKKDPIKWRVLSVDGNDAFIIAEYALDTMPYNKTYKHVTWEDCTLRSWLNGYSAKYNSDGMNYSKNNFIDKAFTAQEQAAIKTTKVINNDNPYTGADGGKNTRDKIFLLSLEEVTNSKYGFSSKVDKDDVLRSIRYTAYAARNEDSDNGVFKGWAADFWLRSPYLANQACVVAGNGYVYAKYNQYLGVNYVDENEYVAVCPALHINLSASGLWSYAGTVSNSKAKENEIAYVAKNGLKKGISGNYYYYKNDKFQKNYTGLVKKGSVQYYVKKGNVQRKFTGIVTCKKVKYYVKEGKVQSNFKGIVTYKKQRYYVKEGKVQSNFKGIVTYKKQKYYVKKGKVQTNYTGKITYKGKTYNIVEGKVSK